jgi:hypothetical protein
MSRRRNTSSKSIILFLTVEDWIIVVPGAFMEPIIIVEVVSICCTLASPVVVGTRFLPDTEIFGPDPQ